MRLYTFEGCSAGISFPVSNMSAATLFCRKFRPRFRKFGVPAEQLLFD
jgi:hypothetical protein